MVIAPAAVFAARLASIEGLAMTNALRIIAALAAVGVGCGGDDDPTTTGILVTPTTGLITAEDGSQATFTVTLNIGNGPTSDVVVDLVSSDTNEGVLDVSQLVFTPEDWQSPRAVVVSGVDDSQTDGHREYTIEVSATRSDDPDYDGLDPSDVTLRNFDNEGVGLSVANSGGLTDESGLSSTLEISLATEPRDDVFVAIASLDITEGSVSVDMLTFTPQDWAAKQTVTVTGVNDDEQDSSQFYTVEARSSSADPFYEGLIKPSMMMNIDDDTVAIIATPDKLQISEDGSEIMTVQVRLATQPLAAVSMTLSVTDTSEAEVGSASLAFDTTNWAAPQPIEVTGVDDSLADGMVNIELHMDPLSSVDTDYKALPVQRVMFSVLDDDTPDVAIVDGGGLLVSEDGTSASFTVRLATEPTGLVDLVRR
jgi:hypothetical protein